MCAQSLRDAAQCDALTSVCAIASRIEYHRREPRSSSRSPRRLVQRELPALARKVETSTSSSLPSRIEAPRADGSILQNIGLIQDLILGHKATNSGIVYLEDELYEFRAKPDGRTWSVYGSPVSPHVIPPVVWEHPDLRTPVRVPLRYHRSGHRISTIGRSTITVERRPRVRSSIAQTPLALTPYDPSPSPELVAAFPKTDILSAVSISGPHPTSDLCSSADLHMDRRTTSST